MENPRLVTIENMKKGTTERKVGRVRRCMTNHELTEDDNRRRGFEMGVLRKTTNSYRHKNRCVSRILNSGPTGNETALLSSGPLCSLSGKLVAEGERGTLHFRRVTATFVESWTVLPRPVL